MIRLAKTEIPPMLEQRVLRMLSDLYTLSKLTGPEIRAVYSPLEEARDALSRILDRADGKHG
jgi:hypothetical protein